MQKSKNLFPATLHLENILTSHQQCLSELAVLKKAVNDILLGHIQITHDIEESLAQTF